MGQSTSGCGSGHPLALNADWTSYRWPSIAPQSKVPSLLDADGYLPLTTEYVGAHAKMPEVATETHAQVGQGPGGGHSHHACGYAHGNNCEY